MGVEITRRAQFCAAHRLHSPHLSEEENKRVYGNCNNPHGHGHNYFLEVTIEDNPDPKTGMIINLVELDEIMQREVIDQVDHRHLNHDSPLMEDTIPTIENMVMIFWNALEGKMPKGTLKKVRLWETEGNSASYSGP